MNTGANFQNMLSEIVKAPNQSRSKKFLKLKRAGLTDAEATNALDQYALFENSDTSTDTFLDSAKAPTKNPMSPAAMTKSVLSPKKPKSFGSKKIKF